MTSLALVEKRNYLVGDVNNAVVLENSLEVPQKVKVTIWPRNYTPRCIFKRNENICPHKNLYINAHKNIIHNSQEVETMAMSINW